MRSLFSNSAFLISDTTFCSNSARLKLLPSELSHCYTKLGFLGYAKSTSGITDGHSGNSDRAKYLDFQVDSLPGLYDGHPTGKHTQKFEIDLLDWLSNPSLARGDALYRDFVCVTPSILVTLRAKTKATQLNVCLEHYQSNEHSRLLSDHLPQGVACASGDIGRCGSTYGYHTPRITVSKMLLPLTTLAGADFVKAWVEVVKCTHILPNYLFCILMRRLSCIQSMHAVGITGLSMAIQAFGI